MKASYNFFPFATNADQICNNNLIDTPTNHTIYDSGTPATPMSFGVTHSYGLGQPEPTQFIYQETPLTRIPYATTRSHNYTEALTAKTFTIPPDKKPLTLTPVRTPEQTTMTLSATASVTKSPSSSSSPTPSQSRASYSRMTNTVFDSQTIVMTDYWISGYSISMSYNDLAGLNYSTIYYGSFSPWISKGTTITHVETKHSWIEYSDGPFEGNKVYTVSITRSVSFIKTPSETLSLSLTVTMVKETMIPTHTYVPSYWWIITETIVEKEITFYIDMGSESEQENQMSAGLIIGLATGGTVIVFILALIGLYIYRNMNFDSDDITMNNESDENATNDILSKTTLEDQLRNIANNTTKTLLEIREEESKDAPIELDDDWLD